MKNITQTANVYQTRTIAKRIQEAGELSRSVLVGTTRDADEEVFARFANIAGVECPGFFDRINLTEVLAYDRRHVLDFTTPAFRTRPGKYSTTSRQKRCVFDEGRVRIVIIRRQADEFEAARFERFAVCLMLL